VTCSKRNLIFSLGIITLFVSLKGLDGFFMNGLEFVSWETWHGPIVGALISGFLVTFFFGICHNEKHIDQGPIKSKTNSPSYFWIGTIGAAMLIIWGLFIRIHWISTWPIDVLRADMFPTVLAGLERVLQGISPYQPIQLTTTKLIPHFYPPLLWLPYFPFYFMGLDIRWLNIIAHGVFYLCLWDIWKNNKPYSWGSLLIFWGVLALHVFSKQMLKQTIDVQTAGFWLFYCIFIWSILRHRLTLTLIMVPCVILSRETGILLIFPYLLSLYWNNKQHFWKTLGTTFVFGLVFCGPWLWMDAKGFFAGLHHYSAFATTLETMNQFFGLSGLLKYFDVFWLQKPLQVLGATLPLLLVIRFKTPLSALAIGGMSYVLFSLWHLVTWHYVYTLPIILAAFLLIQFKLHTEDRSPSLHKL
jgi:hypothetical protein